MKVVLFILLFSLSSYGKTIKIAILDTGMPDFKTNAKICPDGKVDLTKTDMFDKKQHGTNIMGIISDKLKDVDYCLYIIKIFDVKGKTAYISGLVYLYSIMDDLDIVNLSLSGRDDWYLERTLIEGLTSKRIKIIAAAGNEHQDLDKVCKAFPACYSGVVSVGNLLKDGKTPSRYSNYGKRVSVWRIGEDVCANSICESGTSQATAVYTAELALEMSNHK